MPPEGESLPGDCSPKSDTTLKRSLSLCQVDENEKMPTFSADDDITTPLEEPRPNPTPTPAFPVSGSFDSSESEAVDIPERTALKEQKVKAVAENPDGIVSTNEQDNGEKPKTSKPFIGRKFQHYTRVPQLRKDVRAYRYTEITLQYCICCLGGKECNIAS